MTRPVKVQKLRKVNSRKDASHGEHSPYWDHVGRQQNGEDKIEPRRANPDSLPEKEIAAPSTPQLLMGEAIQRLAGRQKEVYILTMREGKSLAEAAEILGLEKGSVQKYKERAIRFITGYCKQAIEGGRV